MQWMTKSRMMVCLGALFVAACTGTVGETTSGAGGSDVGAGGKAGQNSAASSSSSAGGLGGAGNASSSASASSSSNSGASSSSGASGSSSASSSSSSSGSVDPYEGARQTCVDKINALRATKGLPALERWKAAEPCVDQQATWDEMNNKPHGAWGMKLFPSCNGSGQNECLGQGPNGIEGCLDMMWAEKDQAGCSGCDACSAMYNPNCPNCDFFGQATGDVCGHYVNMSAQYFSRVACGFSSLGGWDAINFQ
jgi:hypothetical protein